MVANAARRGAQILYGLITVVALVSAIAVARLSIGPVSLSSFASTVEERINEGLGGWRVAVDDLSLGWDARRNRLRMRLENVALQTPDGRVAATAPGVSVRLHLGDALIGVVSVTDVEVDGLNALLMRRSDGHFRFAVVRAAGDQGVAGGDAPSGAFDAIAAAVESALDATAKDPAAGGGEGLDSIGRLERLSLTGLDLRFVDEIAKTDWRLPDSELQLRSTPAGLEAQLDAPLRLSASAAPIMLELSGARSAQADEIEITANFSGADTQDVAESFPGLAALSALEASVEGSALARLDLETGRIRGATALLSADSARLRLGDGQGMALADLAVDLAFDAEADRVVLSRFSARPTLGGALRLSGHADLRRNETGVIAGATGRITLQEGEFAPGEIFAEGVKFVAGGIDFGVDAEPAILKFENIWLSTEHARLTGAMRASFAESTSLVADIEASSFDATRLASLWPRLAAPGGAEWAAANLRGGRIEGLAIRLAVVDDALREASFRFRFDELEAQYVEGMTPITGARGDVVIDDDGLRLAMEQGVIELGEGRVLNLDGSTMAILDFEPQYPPAEIALSVNGGFGDLLALLDQAPLRLIRKLDADLGEIGGEVAAQAALALPLKKDLPLAEIEVDAEARVDDLALVAPMIGRRVVMSEARLEADVENLRLSGVARLDVHDIDVYWRESFSPEPGEPRTWLELGAVFSAKSLIGWGAPPQLLKRGSLEATAEIAIPRGAAPAVTIEADLAKLSAAAPALGWSKSRGDPGVFRARGELAEDGVALRSFELRSGDLLVEGAGGLDHDGKLNSLTLDPLAVGERTQLALTLSRADDGGLRVTGGGPILTPSLDGLALDSAGSDGDDTATLMQFELDVDEVRIGDNGRLRSVSIRGARHEDGLIDGEALARVRGDAPVTLQLARANGAQNFLLSSEDAGAALEAFGLVARARGGRMRVAGRMPRPGIANGRLEIDDVTLLEAPAAAQALAVGSLIGVFDQMGSGGISLNRVRGAFGVTPTAFDIREAWARGPSLGVVLDGEVSRPDGKLDLYGTISPAFVINGLLSDVPLIGDILTGGSGEGIVAVDFRMRGRLGAPEFAVNPLTALTPGVFRRIFGGGARDRDGPADQPPVGERERGPDK